MTRKILLISINRCSLPYPVFPLGIVHMEAALKAAGYETELLDMQVDAVDLAEVVRNCNPDYIGLSLRNIDNVNLVNTNYYAPELSEVVQKVREVTTVPIILGGSGYSLFPDALLSLTRADFGIWGEGESSFPMLLDCLAKDSSHDHIPGLVFRKNGREITVNPKASCEINTVPSLQRPKDLAGYYIRNSSMLNIQTQRGCAYTCCYCTYPLIEGTAFRYRSPEIVCDDIADAIASGARYFFIVDSVFNTSQEHVTRICEEIIRRKFSIKWGCFLRPKGITQSLMDLMARAGLTHIEFGTDSLCDSVLNAYGKKFTFSDVLQATECAQKAGVNRAHFLIIGGPTETEDTIKEGLNNSHAIKKSAFFPYLGMRLYPDTPLYEFALQEGTILKETDLLPPYFYMSPHISKERILQLLTENSDIKKNMFIGEISPKLQKIMVNLYKIGTVGPLWEYLIQ